MLFTPLPGTSRDDLIQALQAVRDGATNQISGGPSGQRRVMNYLEWAGQAVKQLRGKISEADVRTLLLTPQYDHLLSGFGHMAGSDTQTQRVINELVTMEVGARSADLDDVIATLKSYGERWREVGDLVVLDTCFYVEHPDELKDADLGQLTARTTGGWGMHVLVPLLVVDELDRLKRHGDTKTRARAALKMLNQVFAHVSQQRPMGKLREGVTNPDGSLGPGPITMELVFDPPGHTRLPIDDDEIVDRAADVQSLADRDVLMVTYDQAMSFRARYAGLKEMWLPHPLTPPASPNKQAPRPPRHGAKAAPAVAKK